MTYHSRRKFRSQTSDNMDRWKSRGGKSQIREEKRRKEERRSEKRKSQEKEDAGARKGRKSRFYCFFPMICGSRGSKSRLTKAAGADMWPDEGWTIARRCGAKHISKSKVQKTDGLRALLDVQMSFRVAGARNCALCQKWAKREGFVAFPKTMAGVGHFGWQAQYKRTCSSEMLGGQGADFVRGVAFWSIRSSVLGRWFAWQVQHFVWPGIPVSRRAQYFRQMEWKTCKTHWYKAVSSALNFPCLKEVSQNCCVFDVVKFKNWGSLAE